MLRITEGTFNVGTSAGKSMGAGAGGQLIIEGGTTNIAGRLQTTSTISYTQSGGAVNVCTVGNTATTACFGLTSTLNTFNMSGGNITWVTPSTSATPLDFSTSTATTVVWVTNPVLTTLNVGTGAAAETFRVTGSTPSLNIPANKTMNVGSGAAGAAIFHRGATVVNNGAIAVQGTGTSSRFDWAASGAMTYSGSGTFGTAGTPFTGVGMSANSPTGHNTTVNSPIFVNRVNFSRASIARKRGPRANMPPAPHRRRARPTPRWRTPSRASFALFLRHAPKPSWHRSAPSTPTSTSPAGWARAGPKPPSQRDAAQTCLAEKLTERAEFLGGLAAARAGALVIEPLVSTAFRVSRTRDDGPAADWVTHDAVPQLSGAREEVAVLFAAEVKRLFRTGTPLNAGRTSLVGSVIRSYSVSLLDERLASLQAVERVEAGTRVSPVEIGLNLDIRAGRRLQLDAISERGDAWRAAVTKALRQELNHPEEFDTHLATILDAGRDVLWAFAPDKVTVSWKTMNDPGESVDVPAGVLAPFLKPNSPWRPARR